MAGSRPLAKLRRSGTAFVLVAGAAVAAASGASGAAAVGSDVSSNWAGYVASAGLDPTTGSAQTFATVSGNWVQPAAKCAAATSSTSAAFWVGLGGDSESSNALEQIGTESDCTTNGGARYTAWYELVPAGSVAISLKVSPGDKLAASVGVTGSKVSVKLANLTTGKSFSRLLSMASPDTTSAEWIAEAPSLCASTNESTCRQAALTNFAKISFSHASITSSSGHTGTISDPAWSATALELAGGGGGGFGYGRFAAASSAAQALPGALKSSGSSFAVTWSSQEQQHSDPGYGYDPGYGGGGYPGY
ncbi:MAG TPA: G1 family glutamic endopeptidase [Gaiellaceae bacterium]|nr:G1 family glutamic endopeptidase [Gaiellaceae bacterium]